ncbi:MAG: AMP nucleosidase [Rhodospirillaceae bacterium]|nr:AMP nucleosidase [Rhodospirillaceae bacterium]
MTAPRDTGAGPVLYDDADAAVARLIELYEAGTARLRKAFGEYAEGRLAPGRVRACYPYVGIEVTAFDRVETRLSYGFVDTPGRYTTTVTRPDLFADYLRAQLTHLHTNHGVAIEVGMSDLPIPIHFAFPDGIDGSAVLPVEQVRGVRDVFDVPDLEVMDDAIVNGTHTREAVDGTRPLALFTAPRVDYSLHRLRHYTASDPGHFQNFVLFTNYQFYVTEFVRYAERMLADPESGYTAFVAPGDRVTDAGGDTGGLGEPLERMPQMPAYHLKRPGHGGISLVNIGIGPSNAKTATDHIAVLRPNAWLMLGHCAGLRNTQTLGDYVLAHGYVREDHVLDLDLPTWVPIPALAEVQVALERAVERVTGLSRDAVKSVMRTGTVATIDNRNWELRDYREPVQRFSQSRAIALDMESATVAANGFRFRVPYGTLLCVSDKPLHGELKLPGMASSFYERQVGQHLLIGVCAMELLRDSGLQRLHSRKLRSFAEVAFQ